MATRVRARLQQFFKRTDGAVAIVAAVALPVLIGVSALSVEYGRGLLTRVESQRIADLASYSAALTYARTGGSDSERQLAARRHGERIAILNGIDADRVHVDIVEDRDEIVARAVISANQDLLLARILDNTTALEIMASSSTLIGEADGAACVIALDPSGPGIVLEGGTSLRASACDVASNAAVTVRNCGSQIFAEHVLYNSREAPDQSCGKIVDPDGGNASLRRQESRDPLAGSAAVGQAAAELATTRAMAVAEAVSPPVVPPAPNGMTISWGRVTGMPSGCSAPPSSSGSWVVTCNGEIRTGTVTVEGGVSIRFVFGPDTVFNVAGDIRQQGSQLIFGDGIFNISGDVEAGGSSHVVFGSGAFNIGGSIRQMGSARVSFGAGHVNVAGDLVKDGNEMIFGAGDLRVGGRLEHRKGALRLEGGDFLAREGVSVGGGAHLEIDHDSIRIGSRHGKSIDVGGGGTLHLGGEAATISRFELGGGVRTEGGSCILFGRAENHRIKGDLDLHGAVIFGAGAYAVDGFFNLASGGWHQCAGESMTARGQGVTFIVSGTNSCGAGAFCASGGFANMWLEAPSSGPFAHMLMIGPLDPPNRRGATLTAGTSGTMVSGAFYFPHGPIAMSGGNTTSAVAATCLQLIASDINISGGAQARAGNCLASAGAGEQTIRLVR